MSIKHTRISEKTRDHILGMIVGQALGDAYGLSVEFKDKKWIEEKIPIFNKERVFFESSAIAKIRKIKSMHMKLNLKINIMKHIYKHLLAKIRILLMIKLFMKSGLI